MELIPVFSVKVAGNDADVVVQATLPPAASTAGKLTTKSLVLLSSSVAVIVTLVAACSVLGVPETVSPFKSIPSGKVPVKV